MCFSNNEKKISRLNWGNLKTRDHVDSIETNFEDREKSCGL